MNIRRGIYNRGNNCFINSTLQCLAVSPFIINFLDNYSNNDLKLISTINKYDLGKFKSDKINIECDKILKYNEDNKNNPNHTHINEDDIENLKYISKNNKLLYIYISFKEIIKNLNNGSSDIVDNTMFVSINREMSEHYGFDYLFNGDQNDPHELMVYLLDKLHDSKKKTIQITEPTNLEDLDLYSKLFYENYKKNYEKNYSLFVKNYYYYMLSCVQCNKCKNMTHDVSPSDILCISIPNPETDSIENVDDINIYDCLNNMFKLENIQYCCEKCNNMENNIIEKKIMNSPKTLIIKIKKYYSSGNRLIKSNLFIKYPQVLDMMPYIICDNNQKYELYGVINHVGIFGSGHYYSYIKKYNRKMNKFLNQWYCCNDSNISEISIEEALSSQNAYILFYHYIE